MSPAVGLGPPSALAANTSMPVRVWLSKVCTSQPAQGVGRARSAFSSDSTQLASRRSASTRTAYEDIQDSQVIGDGAEINESLDR